MSFAKLQSSQLQHSSHLTIASKSTVLAGAGLQDAYWSDDEDEDAECPLCLEEMDVAEMGFKPCPCGYQICMFCYHHIKSNLNGRCPACRREYSEEAVEFTAVAKEDLKRQAQQKKRKERERKELEALGRRHFANVRVVQRNVVYVVGLGPRFAKEELIPTLRSNEFFGQYGKISKMIISKRHLPGSKSSVVGVYVTFLRREDATKAINALDGSPSPAGDNETLRASYGTTKYCMSFLRGLNCANNACVDLHEWGDKNDCFTKEDLTTLKHTLRDSENQSRTALRKKPNEVEGHKHLSWSQKPAIASNVQSSQSRLIRSTATRAKNLPPSRPPAADQLRSAQRTHDRRPINLNSPDSSISNKPTNPLVDDIQSTLTATPARASPPEQPSSPILPAVARTRAAESSARSTTPTLNVPDETDGSLVDQVSPILTVQTVPPGLPHPVYQISTPAQELLNDARSRRDISSTSTITSPFPEFDRTLENLGRTDFNFKWSMDVGLTHLGNNDASDPYRGSFDPFSTPISGASQYNERRISHISTPPGLTSSPKPSQANSQAVGGYQGAFNPFSDTDDDSSQLNDIRDGIRQESRFGFARRRPSSSINDSPKFSAYSSPLHPSDFSPHLRQQFGITWSHGPTPRSAFNSPALYSVPPPGISYDYATSHSILKVNNSSSEGRSEQRPLFPPGLNSHLYDNMDDTVRSSLQTGQILDLPMPSTSVNNPISQIPDSSLVSSGFSPPDIRSEFPEGIRSAVMFSQSGTSSNHRNSISSTPANGEFTLGFDDGRVSRVQYRAVPSQYMTNIDVNRKPQYERPASPNSSLTVSWDQPSVSMEKSVLLPEDFPALPTNPVTDLSYKRELQAHSTAKEIKIPQPAIFGRKVTSTIIKDLKLQSKQVEITNLKPLSITTPFTASTPSSNILQHKLAKARKVERKDDKKELKYEPKDDDGEPNPTFIIHKPTEMKDTRKSTKPDKVTVSTPASEHAPMFSKVSKKSKPKEARFSKIPKENKEETKANILETTKDESSVTTGTTTPKSAVAEVSSAASTQSAPLIGYSSSIATLLEQIIGRGFDLSTLAFFNPKLLETDATPLQYDPLVHALSALSIGGGSFVNNLPPVSIDSAVSSFQQLLETLTKTISDLLRLLPPATWDDSSSFDSVLRDMLKGDDFLDDTGDDNSKDDEVAALTLALEKRARWMEVQLAKLEELHRDINMAGVRAILTVSDRGWDPCGFMHQSDVESATNGDSLIRFDTLGMVQGKDMSLRSMTIGELQKALGNAKQEEKAAKQAVLDSIAKIASFFPALYDD